jgi:hypothetical protein
MSRLSSLIACLLAGAAVVAQVVAMPVRATDTLFGQGALAPLLRAEAAVKSGSANEALTSFRIALLRTCREGREDLFARVRLRMLAAGKELAQGGLEKGWPILSQASLLSPDFSRTARAVENWALEGGKGHGPFEYRIISYQDIAEVDGVYPVKAPIWLYRRLSPALSLGHLPGILYNHQIADLPAEGRYAYTYNINLASNGTALKTVYRVRSRGGQSLQWFGSLHHRVVWTPAKAVGPDLLELSFEEPKREYYVDRILVICDGSCPSAEVVAVHTYETLPE